MTTPTLAARLADLGFLIPEALALTTSGGSALPVHLMSTTEPLGVLATLLAHERNEDRLNALPAPIWIGRAHDLPRWRDTSSAAPPAPTAKQLAASIEALRTGSITVADLLEELDEEEAETPRPTRAVISMREGEDALHEEVAAETLLLHIQRQAGLPPSLRGDEGEALTSAPALLLAASPDERPESILPLLDFGGVDSSPPAAHHVIVLRYWAERWGARLVALSPSRLDVVTTRQPQSWREAFELAQEHLDYCPPMARRAPGALKLRAEQLQSSPLWSFDWSAG